MSCNHCDKNKCITDIGRGCCFCANEEHEVCLCQGGQKLNVTDWLAEMPKNYPDDIFEIKFKNTRKGYYKNTNDLPLKKGDVVAVESSPGHDIGIVSLTGDLVYRQMKRAGFNAANAEFKKIYRKAKPYDIEKWQEAIALEHPTMIESRQIAADLHLNMKIGDVEYQGDRIKAIFYYIADERVDFRKLIKILADRFKIRVEMKQIGTRQEAGRIGGIGACGRELCCSSWISNFVSVTTNAARIQEISLNPQKLAGQCSKLKCCLIYELDSYIDARKEFPRLNGPLEVLDGNYYLVKTDIFSRTMYFSSEPHSSLVTVTVPVDRVKYILGQNRKGKKPDRILPEPDKSLVVKEPEFLNVVGEDSITRFDEARKDRGRNKRKSKSRGSGSNVPKNTQPRSGEEKKSGENRRKPTPRPEGEQAQRQNQGDEKKPPRRPNRNRGPRKPKNE